MKRALFAWFIVIAVFACPSFVFGDAGRLTIGAETGVYYPWFEYDGVDTFDGEISWSYGSHVSYGVSEHANIQAGWIFTIQDIDIGEDDTVTMIYQDVMLGVRWAILTGWIRPTVSLGGSFNIINLEEPLKDLTAFGPHIGAGMEFVATKNLSLGLIGYGEYMFGQKLVRAFGVHGLFFFNFTF
jgi:hypothetical protein